MKTKHILAVRDGKITADELLAIYPVKEVVNDLMEIIRNNAEFEEIVKPNPKPIAVTEEEFERIKGMFRVKGFDLQGNASNRGRKAKQSIKAED